MSDVGVEPEMFPITTTYFDFIDILDETCREGARC